MLIRIKNGYLASQKAVEIPYSKIREELANILLKEGYLAKVETKKTKSGSGKKAVEIKILNAILKYEGRKSSLGGIKIISKPSRRVYVKKDKIYDVLGGRGLLILSTPKGLMTGKEARKKGLGGEVVGKIW